jgi:hypothetical protein
MWDQMNSACFPSFSLLDGQGPNKLCHGRLCNILSSTTTTFSVSIQCEDDQRLLPDFKSVATLFKSEQKCTSHNKILNERNP